MILAVFVVVVDLPDERFTCKEYHAEIMFPVGIIVLVKLRVVLNLSEEFEVGFTRKVVDVACDVHDAAVERPTKRVVQFSDGIHEFHIIPVSAIDVVPPALTTM